MFERFERELQRRHPRLYATLEFLSGALCVFGIPALIATLAVGAGLPF